MRASENGVCADCAGAHPVFGRLAWSGDFKKVYIGKIEMTTSPPVFRLPGNDSGCGGVI